MPAASAVPVCPYFVACTQRAAMLVISLVLGILPRKTSKIPIDMLLVNMVAAGEASNHVITLALLRDDPQRGVKRRASLAVEASILRSTARDVALWLAVGGSPSPAASIPSPMLPDGSIVELLADLLEAGGKDADDPLTLGGEALKRWNLLLAVFTEPALGALVDELVKVVLGGEPITPEHLDLAVEQTEGAADALDEYGVAVGALLEEWHRAVVVESDGDGAEEAPTA
jgi:hypothetical protein